MAEPIRGNFLTQFEVFQNKKKQAQNKIKPQPVKTIVKGGPDGKK